MATSLRFSRWCCRRFKNLLVRYSANFPKFLAVIVPSALGSIGSRRGLECLDPEEDNTVIVRRVAVPHPSTSITEYSTSLLRERQITHTKYLSQKFFFFVKFHHCFMSLTQLYCFFFFYQICVEIVIPCVILFVG